MLYSILVLIIFTNFSKIYGSFIDDPKDYPQTSYPDYSTSKFRYPGRRFGMYFVTSKQDHKYNDNFCENMGHEKVFIKQEMDLEAYRAATRK